MPPSSWSFRAVGCAVAASLIGLASAGVRADWPNRQSDTVEKLITELDDRAAAWAATARLQEHPEAALTLLLRPGFVTTGPHGDWSPRMLALAKLGAGAIPSIGSRIRAIGTPHAAGTDASELRALVMILGSFGPPAVPALLEIAALGESRYGAFLALQAIAELEPRSSIYGQEVGPWAFWRPADNRVEELEEALGPRLPLIEQVVERAIAESPAYSSEPPQRPGAYLLARWGTGHYRERGIEVLNNLAATDGPFYQALDAIRFLHRLRAPTTADFIRRTAVRVPESDLKASYLLHMAIALYQLGDRNYESLLQWPLQNGPVHVRREAQEFIAAAKGVAEMPDNVRQCDGSDGRRGLGGADPVGRQGPGVVTLLLDLTQRGVVGAREALSTCLQSVDPDVRMFGALALSAYDREAAVEHLAGELRNSALWLRGRASQFLLQLSDARGIPGRIDQLESSEDAIRKFACRDLRWYTQQLLPCDGADRSVPRSRITVWREWWRDNAALFRVRTREAKLDRQAFPAITAVGFGIPPVR